MVGMQLVMHALLRHRLHTVSLSHLQHLLARRRELLAADSVLEPASLGSLQLFHFEVRYFSLLMLSYCSILLRYCSRSYRSRYASDSTVGTGFIDGIERNILPVCPEQTPRGVRRRAGRHWQSWPISYIDVDRQRPPSSLFSSGWQALID